MVLLLVVTELQMALETEKLSKEDIMIKMGMLTWILTIQIMEIRSNTQK